MSTSDQNSSNGAEGGDVLTTDAKDLMCEKLLASEEMEQKTPTVYHQFVSPRTLTGPANQLNMSKGAINWSYNGLVAYGSNYTVVVVDTTNMQPVQCLDRHKSIVNNVLWSPAVRNKVDDAASVELVSSDLTGHIIHWDITIGNPLVVLQDGTKPVLGMEWVPGERNDLLLATLHSPYYFVMWDINKQAKLWKKAFLDNIFYFQFNPFNNNEIAFMCTDCILFLDEFNPNKIPSSNGRKFYISSPRVGEFEDSSRTRDRLKKLMKGLVIGDSKPRPEDTMTVSEIVGLSYHRSLRHHMLLQYSRDILIIDLLINQTVGIISVEKAVTPIVQVIPARQRDVLYCLHDAGSVSVKVRRRTGGAVILPSPLDAPAESVSSLDINAGNAGEAFLSYEHRCQSEVIRQMKGSKVLALALDPITEKNIVLLLSSGKLVHLELDVMGLSDNEDIPLCLSQMFKPAYDEKCVVPPLRLMTTGLLSAVASPLTVIRMCPPLTTRNRPHYNPIMAGGTLSGIVQIYNMATGLIEKEFALHNHPVRGIEWTGLTSFLSFAFSGHAGKVVNELLLTDVLSGQTTQLRHNRPAENPMDMIRVSPLRQYFVVSYKDGPFELWDLKTLSLLRTMPKKFPFVTALEWSPVHSVKSLHAKTSQRRPNEESSPATSPIAEPGVELVAKEHIVFSDTESHLYHFSVDGSSVKDGIKIPPETGVGMITCIAFKSNQIVQADVDGSLNIWDLKSRSSRSQSTGRGWIRKLRFSPGKGNLKLLILYSDGVDIVDLKNLQYERLAQLKCPKDMVKVVDIDWAAPDTPVLATEDGCLRVMDCKLTQSASSLPDYTFKDPVCCPALLPPSVYSHLQLLLSTRLLGPPSPLYTVEDGFALDHLEAVNDQLDMMRLDMLDRSEMGTVKRSLIAALLMRDQFSINFWTVCQYYLQVAAYTKEKNEEKPKQVEHYDSYSASDLKRINQFPNLEPLDTCYDVLCDPYAYQKLQLERVSVHEWRRGDYKHTQKVVERLILLGEMDRAVQLLLETDLDNSNYYTDGIKACLVATIQSTGAAQSTIKLVATNLIANGKIWEGVQLLCLIGKGLDGCRYLSSYGLWESAVWLAKSTLPSGETLEVLRKWADHLTIMGEKEMAMLVLLSQGQMDRVLEMLLTQGQVVRAGLLLLALQEISYSVDKSLFTAVQSRFCEHTKLCEPLAEAMAKQQAIC